MLRRTVVRWLASAVAFVPIARIRVFAQPRDLSTDAIALLREIAPTVLPASLGADRINGVVDAFVAWTRGYREGVPLSHGYGHPRLVKSGASPVPRYAAQLNALAAAARAKGAARWSALDLEARRGLLDDALATANVRNLPGRPAGQHVIADLMATYFRSSQANDECYRALINREVCRPIAITTRKPKAIR
jgi:hypothetical protein